MGRIGITLLDVEKAALELQAQGKIPTVDGIRSILNTGSKTTIGEHLKIWKAKQMDGKGQLPQPLLTLVTNLWEELQAQATVRIDSMAVEHAEEAKKSHQTISHLTQENSHLKDDLYQRQELLEAEQQAKDVRTLELQHLQSSYDKLQVEQLGLIEKLAEERAENARLHQLANQMQANLAHYQEAMQQLRTEQVMEFERQQAIWQQEISSLKNSLFNTEEKAKNFEQKLLQKETIYIQMEQQLVILATKCDEQNNQLHENEQMLAMLTERCKNHENALLQQHQLIDKKSKHLHSVEKENAVLSDKLLRIEKELQKSQDKVEALQNDKLFAIQEKTELLGQLKQIEKIGKNKITEELI